MKTAKIVKINESQPFESQYGTLYPHWLTFDNGDSGLINKKKPGAYSEGQSMDYELEEKQGQKGPYHKIKEVKEKFGGGGGRGGNASFALAYAKDVAVKNIEMAGKPLPMDQLAAKVIDLADTFYDWLESKR